MSCNDSARRLVLAAGEDRDEPFTFFSDDKTRTPLNLTDAKVSMVVMESFSAPETWVVWSQTEHEDADAGRTRLAIDLTDVDAAWRVSGKLLVGSLWVVDAQGQRHHFGNYTIEIQAAAPLPAD